MKNLKFSESRRTQAFAFAVCILVIAIIILKQADITENCLKAINTCLNIIIPSLFPIQIFMYFILYTGLPLGFKRKLHNITVRLFGLSGYCAEGILVGSTGGYNSAIKTAVALYKKKEITIEEAKRLSVCFSNPGISFCVIIFGNSIYKSFSLGLFVFIISNLINFVIAFIKNKKKCYSRSINTSTQNKTSLSDCFISSVNDAGKTVISICLWIIVFAVIKAIAKSIIPIESFIKVFDIFSDISTGIFYASENYSLPFSVFALLSGGLCVILQQTEDIRFLNINLGEMIFIKLFNAVATSLITSLALKLNLFSNIIFTVSYQVKYISGTPVSSLSLLLLLAVFFSLSCERKNYNYQFN